MTKTHDMKQFSLFAGFFLLSAGIWANDIRVTNASLTGQNPGSNTYQVKFDLAWDNSWRTSIFESNWDAAWVFIKFRERSSTVWNHAQLNTTGFVTSSGATVKVSPDNMGAMIYRSANGIGNVSYANLELQWDYGNSITDIDRVEVDVMAVEMVYVPQGSFYVGDGNRPANRFKFSQGGSTAPLQIVNESYLELGGVAPYALASNFSTVELNGDDFTNTVLQILPTTFPKGYKAFYCMKYECSMGQYVDFLNKLTATQASANFIVPRANFLYGFTITNLGAAPNRYQTTTPDRACNYMRWRNTTAYADWAGLRPMTELEYEKACRGPETSVPEEFAFGGSFNCLQDAGNIQNSGAASESISNLCTGSGNANITSVANPGANYIYRPMRCGIYAASAVNKTREETGATHYGIMEMSGNVEEMCVGVGSPEMRIFTGVHGNGTLASNGFATINNLSNESYTKRGGTFYLGEEYAQTSSRTAPVLYDNDLYNNNPNGVLSNPQNLEEGQGIRLVRSDF